VIFQQKHCRPEDSGMTYSMSGKENYIQPRILYPAKFSFRIEEEIKNFPDKT